MQGLKTKKMLAVIFSTKKYGLKNKWIKNC